LFECDRGNPQKRPKPTGAVQRVKEEEKKRNKNNNKKYKGMQ